MVGSCVERMPKRVARMEGTRRQGRPARSRWINEEKKGVQQLMGVRGTGEMSLWIGMRAGEESFWKPRVKYGL